MRLASVAVILAVLVAGCGGGNGGPVQLSATPATIGDDALEATGYEPAGSSDGWVNKTVSVSISGDVELEASKDVRARTPLRTYRRATGDGPAVVGLLTVPGVHLLESSADIVRNPAADLGPADLGSQLSAPYSGIEVGEQVSNETVMVLGNETHLVTYAATARADGSSVDLRLSIATVRDGDEFVTFVALYPATVDEGERVRQLLGAVRH